MPCTARHIAWIAILPFVFLYVVERSWSRTSGEKKRGNSSPYYGRLYGNRMARPIHADCGAGLPGARTIRVLVTGAAGFIGSHVSRYCVESLGYEVVGVDDLSGPGGTHNVANGVFFVAGDLKDISFVNCVFHRYGAFDFVYHIAAYGGQGMSHFIRNSVYSTNVLASANLINAAVTEDVKHFVFISSCAVYGASTEMKEDAHVTPRDPYAISKLATELDLQSANTVFGLNFTILRPHNVYGPGQSINDRFRNVIGIWIRQLNRNEKITLFGNGEQTRAFTFVDDITWKIAQAPTTPLACNEIVNIGSAVPVKLVDVVQSIANILKVSADVVMLPGRTEVKNVEPNHEKSDVIFQTLVPEIGIAEGLKKMIVWASSLHWDADAHHVLPEIVKGMPETWLGHFALSNTSDAFTFTSVSWSKPTSTSADLTIGSKDLRSLHISDHVVHQKCRFDDHELVDFLDFGNVPLGNNFLLNHSIENEPFYPLTVKYCAYCGAVQVNVVPSLQSTVWEQYAYRSSVIPALTEQFAKYAKEFSQLWHGDWKSKAVLEIGCNDGVFLKPLARLGFAVTGIDPAKDAVGHLQSAGYDVISDFFFLRTAKQMSDSHGHMDAIVTSNSFAHVDNMQDIMEGVVHLLKSDGVLAIQVPT